MHIRNKNDKNTILLVRRTALATAVACAMVPAESLAEDWSRNIEVFAMPTSQSRNLMGGQWLEPVWQNQTSMVYLDFRGVFDLGDTEEFNIGAGYRRLFLDRRWIFGGYASFDTRESLNDKRHNQISLGIEALSREWDFRANGYIPLTDDRTIGISTIGGQFQGTRLFAGRRTEEALYGADFEIGRLLGFIPFGETRLFIGGYHFDGDFVTKSTGFGKKVRLEFRPRKDIALEIGAEDDNLFGTEGFIKIRYSFGLPAETGVRTIDERMVQFAERDIDIRETSRLGDELTTATGPRDGILITENVVHIDNTADDGGDGSFEDPYNDFTECQADRCAQTRTLVYVHAGDGTAAGYDVPFNMTDNQRLIGQGFNLYGIGGDRAPTVTHGATSTIRLANNNEIAGLNLINNRVAIFGNNVTGFNIHDNRIAGSTSRGMRIVTANGNTTGVIANNTISGNANYGVLLDNDADGASSTQSVTLSNNTITNNTGYGIGIRNAGRNGSSATQTVTLTGNTVSGNDSGMYGRNLSVNSGIAMQTINAANNSFINNNTFHGVYAANENSAGGTATQSLDLSDSDLSGNFQYGGSFNNLNGTQTVNLTGADTSGNGSGGYTTSGSPAPVVTPP